MENFCAYCCVVLGSEEDFQSHCISESHQLMIMSDEGREWKFRPPARGVPADQYALCPMFTLSGKCRLGQQCCDAHGEEELNEWKERYDYRQMKMQHAKECSLQGSSYTETLLEKWLSTANPLNIMAEKLDNVDVSIEPETNLTVSEKNCCREWTIQISSKTSLQHVALLYETHRSHFRLSQLLHEQSPGNFKDFNLGNQCQEWSAASESEIPGGVYMCKVRFVTSIYGTFRQAIVFDFGYEPVLIQKLSVDVVSISDLEKLQQVRESVVSFTERWRSDEVTIVPFENRPYSIGEHEKNLLACYPAPESSKFTLTQAVLEPVLTKDNYSSRLHELLCIEEMAQYDLLSKYNVKAHLNLSSCYLLTPNSAATAKYAHNGELFANMKLSSVLSEDSASGRLILTNCSTVLIAAAKSKGSQPRKVYEALIEDKGKTVIYIRLSKQCTEELNLQPDRELLAEVQFQLNRLPLCEMHFAVDRLHPPSLVFPDVTQLPPLIWNTESWNHKLDTRLNSKQKEAVLAITASISLKLPPVLIIGPFGTGKTFTLACAVKLLLSDPHSRVLVCTHSNSAADIYIREYLHPLVAEGHPEAAPLRIYYRHRWVATVHPTVLQYCLISKTDSDRSFNMPTISDVKRHKVVVTTLSTSRYLVQLGLEKGFFSHILIDEAAQAMECEAIMPLSLANDSTRIVLAGDHMQLSPEVYSQIAQDRNLHTSLLERLYDLYPEKFACKILLCENYRSHEAIIQYTSELFYDNHLIASAQQPRHEKYYPLAFFTARGEDVQDVNSTAYHNNAEVYEIVERVIELKKSWPEVWGEQDETSIGVVTPYYDQVVRIRAELRKKKLHGVSVERVLNVQGKQFRVIFLSAVRTRQTCNGPKLKESDLDHGFLSNARLLNTAITRAQSLVAVVGDPVSLCSVGKCRKLWEKFIHTCHKENSLFGITWDSLRSHLDSMELKKNFILNPLAPEFVPGRMFHGQPNIPTSSGEMLCLPSGTSPQPWLFIPIPTSPFQGTPIMQSAMPHVVPQPVPPHSYNLGLNCVAPPVMAPPTMPPHPFSAPFPTPHTIPQSNVLPTRMSSGMFQRRVGAPRLPMEPSGQVKEYDRSCVIGRPIKRSGAFPLFNVNNNKPSLLARIEELRNTNQGFDESRRHVPRNDSLPGNVTHIPEQMEAPGGFQSMFCANDKLVKPNVMKQEENIGVLKQNLQSEVNMNNFNMSEQVMLQTGYKCNSVNGTRLSMQQKPVLEPEANIFPNDVGFFQNTENFNMRQVHNNQQFQNSEVNNSAVADKERVFASALDDLIGASSVNPQPQNYPSVAERWTTSTETPPRLEVLQASLQEKLVLLEKVLPPGTDLRNFLESPVSSKTFFSHLYTTEGPLVAKRFIHLMMSIKHDQEALIRHQYLNNSLERREFSNTLTRNASESSIPLRYQSTPFVNRPPMVSQQSEITNGYDPFRFESPLAFHRSFAADKNDSPRSSLNGENKNGYVRMPSNFSSLLKSRGSPQEIFSNGPGIEKSQEQLLYELRKLALNNRNENTNLKPSLSPENPLFHGESISEAVRRAELERQLRESQKDLWVPLQTHTKQSHNDVAQESYLSKIRNISNTASSSAPLPSFEASASSPTDSRGPGHMTALSVSYPDIPDILPSHIHPSNSSNNTTSKEPDAGKVIQKPNNPANDPPTTNTQRPSPYIFDFPVQQRNNSPAVSIPYSHVTTEGMTYAKILRSPHP